MKAWAPKYKEVGLVVIGVQAPEFGFEKDPANVKNAIYDLEVCRQLPANGSERLSGGGGQPGRTAYPEHGIGLGDRLLRRSRFSFRKTDMPVASIPILRWLAGRQRLLQTSATISTS